MNVTPRVADHAYIFATILFTVYSQLVMRWQVGLAGRLPDGVGAKALYVFDLLLNPWILSGIVATFLAGVSWMLAMTKFEISYAFPYIGLNFVVILAASALLFAEPLTTSKVVGTALVVLGIAVIARG